MSGKEYNPSEFKTWSEEKYLKERLQDQLEWYDNKSVWNQKWFKRWQLVEITPAILITFLSGQSENIPYSGWLLGILAGIIAIAASIISLNKFQENWINYRTTAEQLKHEKMLYLTKSAPYNTEERFHNLVQRIESLLSKENSNWAQVFKQKDDNKD